MKYVFFTLSVLCMIAFTFLLFARVGTETTEGSAGVLSLVPISSIFFFTGAFVEAYENKSDKLPACRNGVLFSLVILLIILSTLI